MHAQAWSMSWLSITLRMKKCFFLNPITVINRTNSGHKLFLNTSTNLFNDGPWYNGQWSQNRWDYNIFSQKSCTMLFYADKGHIYRNRSSTKVQRINRKKLANIRNILYFLNVQLIVIQFVCELVTLKISVIYHK